MAQHGYVDEFGKEHYPSDKNEQLSCLVNLLGFECKAPCTYVLRKDDHMGLCEEHAQLVGKELRRALKPEENKPRFEMLSRKDYEIEMQKLDALSAQVSRQCASGAIDAWETLAWDRELEKRREELKRRLFITGMILFRRHHKAPKGDTAPVFAEVPADKGRALSDQGIAIVKWNWSQATGTRTEVRIERSNYAENS